MDVKWDLPCNTDKYFDEMRKLEQDSKAPVTVKQCMSFKIKYLHLVMAKIVETVVQNFDQTPFKRPATSGYSKMLQQRKKKRIWLHFKSPT